MDGEIGSRPIRPSLRGCPQICAVLDSSQQAARTCRQSLASVLETELVLAASVRASGTRRGGPRAA